ncbi:MAG: hypothetical protein V1894_00365 [Chloroflexota bacterium]
MLILSPGDEALPALALSSVSAGNFRTETLKAYPEAEFRNIISRISH